MGPFDKLYDLNCDGKLDELEGMLALGAVMELLRDEDEDEEEDEDEFDGDYDDEDF